ncbi:MAG TPA: hypothetical protein VJ801_17985 [Polyangia bacterium]|nr:hypothetical protein [Polyangia bacterium]
MFDARRTGNSSSPPAGGLDPETLVVARRIRAQDCAKVGLVPLHAGLDVMPTARRLACAFEVMGDRVAVLDTDSPPVPAEQTGTPEAGEGSAPSARGKVGRADRPAALERALEDAGARFNRVLVAFGAPGVAGPAASLLYALDGVVLVTRSGGATESRLHKWLRRIDPQRQLGVLFVQ